MRQHYTTIFGPGMVYSLLDVRGRYQLTVESGVTSVRSNGLITTPRYITNTIGWFQFHLLDGSKLLFILVFSREGSKGGPTAAPFGPINVALIPSNSTRWVRPPNCPRNMSCPPIQRHGLSWTCPHMNYRKSFLTSPSARVKSHVLSYPGDA